MPSPSSPLAPYRPLGGAWDEVRDGTRIRPVWVPLIDAVERLGAEGLRQRVEAVNSALDQDGVTYNLFGRRDQRWGLDPIPAIVSADEWRTIEPGVAQRAELMAAVLADLYGARRLVADGLLPPDVVFGHPGFVRALDQVDGAADLVLHAVDLGRDGAGELRVLGDRSEAPSGFGYAFENRSVVGRVFPNMIRHAEASRLAPFFRSLRAALTAAAPPGVDEPSTVVLSPGPDSETAFEHAFLASYLGVPLAEGDDLVVDQGRLWLRSLGGREPVHVVLRRIDAAWCDPLELRKGSRLGVAGLVEAVRRGSVRVVNPLGAGVLENPALLPFLPAVCSAVLGEDLRLPSVDSWWCGDPASRSHVLANLRDLVIQPIGRRTGATSVFGAELSAEERHALALSIEARPHAWVGLEHLPLTSTPVVDGDGTLVARRSVLRTFAVDGPAGWSVLAGGLTRVAPGDRTLRVTNSAGALSKDTWVLAGRRESGDGYWLQAAPAPRTEQRVPPRAAENFFWLGRYAERAESAARLMRVAIDRLVDLSGPGATTGAACTRVLLQALTRGTGTEPGFLDARPLLERPDGELFALATDVDRDGTLAHTVFRLLAATRAVRDQLSADTWVVAGRLDRRLLDLARRSGDADTVRPVLDSVLADLLALGGLAAEHMVRDQAFAFLDVGRRIERSLQLLTLLEATLVERDDVSTESLVLESVLTTAESILTYRRRYRSRAGVETALELLLADDRNPRSLRAQLVALRGDLDQLATDGAATSDEVESLVRRLDAAVRTVEIGSLVEGDPRRLGGFCRETAADLTLVAQQFEAHHFARHLTQRTFEARQT